jgi:hypothetical protein
VDRFLQRFVEEGRGQDRHAGHRQRDRAGRSERDQCQHRQRYAAAEQQLTLQQRQKLVFLPVLQVDAGVAVEELETGERQPHCLSESELLALPASSTAGRSPTAARCPDDGQLADSGEAA